MREQWLQRWREERIGFHRNDTHPALANFWPSLDIPVGTKVLVPLCGKSLDMHWLADAGYPVLGVELAPDAIEQFLDEQQGSRPQAGVSRYRQGGFAIARQGMVELWQGDFFHLHIRQVDEVGAFYDRASLIALPPATRQRYAFHLAQLVPAGAQGLLVSLHHDEGDKGPPYSVNKAEIETLFIPNFVLTELGSGARDAQGRVESVWGLRRRGPLA